MPQTVSIRGVGVIEFPDNFSKEQIEQAIRNRLGLTNVPREIGNVKLNAEEQIAYSQADIPGKRLIIANAAGRSVGRDDAGLRTAIREFLPFGVGTGVAAITQFVKQQIGSLAPGDQRGIAQEGGIGQRFSEALAAERGRTQGLREEAPGAAITGAVIGGVATGGGIARGGGALLERLGARGVASRAAAAFAPRQGQTVRNILRTGAAAGSLGAAEGAVGATVEGTDPITGAELGFAGGAVLGPAVGGLVRGGSSAGRRLFPSSTAQGFRFIARRLLPEGAPRRDILNLADDMQERALHFREVTGRKPSIVEILNDSEAEELGLLASSQPGVGEIVQDAERAALLSRPRQLSAAIQGDRLPAPTLRQAAVSRQELGDRLLQPIQDKVVRLPRDLVDDADFQSALPRNLRARVNEAADKAVRQGNETDVPLRVLDIDDARIALSSKAGRGTGADRVFVELADEVRGIAGDQVPEYASALRSLRRRREFEEGLSTGRGVTSGEDTGRFVDEALNRAAPSRVGTRRAARTRLAERAGESPRGAVDTAVRLAEDPGLQTRVGAALPGEAARLRGLGEAETRGARNLNVIARSTRRATRSAEEQQLSEGITDILFASQAGGAFRASLVAQIIQKLRIPRTAATKAVNALADPKRTDEALRVLKQAGVDIQRLEQIILATALSAGQTSRRAAAIAEQ